MNIDFVIPWVDGNDPAWQAEKAKYQGGAAEDGNSVNRFRDWGLLHFWFRAVERFTPWVGRIYFITWGHLPEFLNAGHPKLRIVRHEDYIPAEYRPTFNANAIELNIHRIPGLSERFVYFNDDTYILRAMGEEKFFRDDRPCAYGAEVPFAVTGRAGIWQHIILNDLRVINSRFKKSEQVKKYGNMYRDRRYGIKTNIRTLAAERLFPEYFLGFKNLHAPAAFCKSTFETIWEREPELLRETCSHRFRTADDVNQWLAVWWQVAAGSFAPALIDNVVSGADEETIDGICSVIRGQSHDMLCINDPSEDIGFAALSERLKRELEVILPEKSSFEK